MNSTYQHKNECDNECPEYISTDCLIYREAAEYLGLEAGAKTTDIIRKLVETVEYLQLQINTINEV